jgi:hypothetical protein
MQASDERHARRQDGANATRTWSSLGSKGSTQPWQSNPWRLTSRRDNRVIVAGLEERSDLLVFDGSVPLH